MARGWGRGGERKTEEEEGEKEELGVRKRGRISDRDVAR